MPSVELRQADIRQSCFAGIEYRDASGKMERLPALANEVASMSVEIIVTSGEPAALAAKRATRTVPIVVTELGLDPVKAGRLSLIA